MLMLKPIKRRRSKVRPGRLRGKPMKQLRHDCFDRDKGICQWCFELVDPNNWHLAHKRGKRMWGDSLDNVAVKHPRCHIVIEHQNGGVEKIVPKK